MCAHDIPESNVCLAHQPQSMKASCTALHGCPSCHYCLLAGEDLQQRLLQETAQCTQLDVSARALCMELVRVKGASGTEQRSLSQLQAESDDPVCCMS